MSDPTAVVGRRIGAFLIDGLIGVTLIFAFALATFTNTELGDSLTAELQCEVINEFSNDLCIQAGTTVYVGTENEAAIITLIWLAWVLISTMILPGITGWSPGKLLTGIRVVKADTFEKAGLGANILRGVLWVVDAFPYFAPIVGGALLASKDHRRVGDRAANTLVVRADSVGSVTGADPVGRHRASDRRRNATDHPSSPNGTACQQPGDGIATTTCGTQSATTSRYPTTTHLTGAARRSATDRRAFRLPAAAAFGVPHRARPTGVPTTGCSADIPTGRGSCTRRATPDRRTRDGTRSRGGPDRRSGTGYDSRT